MAVLRYIDLGRASYETALALQRRLLEEVSAARDAQAACEARPTCGPPAYVILVEHVPPVITLGRSAKPQHVLATPEALAAAEIEVHQAARGGDVTYHGPGQLVGYPILRLDVRPGGVRQYLRDLEEVLIRLCGRLGVQAGRVPEATGVWSDGRKVAAIGVAVRRWVTWHGFALNVAVNLKHFDLIVPCGLADKEVTDLAHLLDRPVTVREVKRPLLECLAEVFGFDSVQEEKPA